ncbi:DUF4190 domain-containing protein [Nocardioides sp. SYSU D00038]|uniref:DUF4190 domain-containing protein n=1 Tax=Nocardioides sp. SYSU D00038 TaxID=2812554 RepID=UPI001966D2A9|nr:DUF4190 domain-containing protein [Nocardioides sp. SYSU D00038]
MSSDQSPPGPGPDQEPTQPEYGAPPPPDAPENPFPAPPPSGPTSSGPSSWGPHSAGPPLPPSGANPYGAPPPHDPPPPYGVPGAGGPGATDGYPTPPQTPGSAITSLVLGITSIALCCFPVGIPAILLGTRAMREIDAAPAGTRAGRGLALSGVVTGIVGVVASLALIGLLLIGLAVDDAPDETCVDSDGFPTQC